MKTKHLELLPNWIETDSFWTCWHSNGQMWWHEGMKDGLNHGDYKWWLSDGRLGRHLIHENGRLVKEIL